MLRYPPETAPEPLEAVHGKQFIPPLPSVALGRGLSNFKTSCCYIAPNLLNIGYFLCYKFRGLIRFGGGFDTLWGGGLTRFYNKRRVFLGMKNPGCGPGLGRLQITTVSVICRGLS